MDEALRRLMKYVENMPDYKVHLYGWIRKINETWVKLPKNNYEAGNVLAGAERVSKGMTRRELHGILFGRALRSLKPPAGTTGTLLTWISGSYNYSVQEHRSDNHVQMKKITNHQKEDVCIIYFFYYMQMLDQNDGVNIHPKKVKIEEPQPPQPMDVERES